MIIARTFTTAESMATQCLWLLLIAQLVRISTQLCTIEEFKNNRAHDLVHSSEASEVSHNITVMEVIYNCLATSHEIGIYNSMSVSILYIRSDTPDRLRSVRYDILCQRNTWQRTRQVQTVFISNNTRYDCANCWGGRINESDPDHHCTPCNDSCTGLHQCYGLMASECCNFIDDGSCTDDCGIHREGNSSFHCVCSGYWTGDDCENCNLTCLYGTPKSDCSACQCIPGYGGIMCDAEINECDPNPCQNGGKCTDLFNDYNCTGCAVGYTGKNCSRNIDDCKPYSCLNNGKCVDDVNSYTCLCMAGYSGSKCEININECSGSPCKNGGTCVDAINSYTCTCVAGYTGKKCETEIDECSSSPCQNEGTCTDLINNYTCTCKPLHTGPNCSDCAMVDCEECIENKDMAVGECTKCIGAHVLDQGTCNDNCGIANCIVCNVMDRMCTRCKEGYRLSSENECNGKTPDEEESEHTIIIIMMSIVVLLLLIAIIITAVVLFYECKKPERRKSNNPSSGYNYL